MNKKLYTYITCLLILVTANRAFSQQIIDTLELNIGKDQSAFTEKVRIVAVKKQNQVLIKDGSYRIGSGTQKANIVLAAMLINGTVSVSREGNTRTDYVIVDSFISTLKTYTDSVLTVDAYKDKTEVYFKEYNANRTLKIEGNMSLDKNKHYGKGIVKWYDEHGNIQKTDNSITETHTDFYPNGEKKAVFTLNFQESYDETGKLSDRQYRKNDIHYVDDYIDGKLYTRSYENNDKSEVKEYYKNNVLEKKEVLKTVKSQKRLFTYNKIGKLISDELYTPPAKVEVFDIGNKQ